MLMCLYAEHPGPQMRISVRKFVTVDCLLTSVHPQNPTLRTIGRQQARTLESHVLLVPKN
jgi:hypothetical protein